MYCACGPPFPRLLQHIQGRSLVPTSTHNKWSRIDDSRSGSPMSDFEFEFERLPQNNNQPTMATRYYNQPTRSAHPHLPRKGSKLNPNPRNSPSPTPIETKKSVRRTPIHQVSARSSFGLTVPSTPVFTIPEDAVPITPSSPTQSHFQFPASPTTTSWPSPTQTEFSVAEVGDATHVRMQPVYFATIRKTVDVRVSSHTAPGSPLAWRKGSMGW